jgi:hypothetical protein
MRLCAHLGWVQVTCASRVFWRHLRSKTGQTVDGQRESGHWAVLEM